MKQKSSIDVISTLQVYSRISGALACIVGAIVANGWMFDIALLKSLHPALVSMKANTAIALMLSGVSLWFFHSPWKSTFKAWIVSFCAAPVAAIGLLTFIEYVGSWNFGIDQLFFIESIGTVGTYIPGRMALNTAFCFSCLGIALLLVRSKSIVPIVTSQLLTLASALVALTALIGYFYSLNEFYGYARFTQMAVHTAVTLLILSTGILCTVPDRGMMVVFSGDDFGGFLARRLLPATIAIPILIGWLRLEGERHEFFGSAFGVLLVAVVYIVLFMVLVWKVSKSLNRFDSERKWNQEVMRQSETRFRDLTENTSDWIWEVDAQMKYIYASPRVQELLGYTALEIIGKTPFDFMPSIEAKHLQNDFEELKKKAAPFHSIENKNIHKDGTIRILETSGVPIFDPEGKFKGFRGIDRDITVRKRTENTIKMNEVRLESLFKISQHNAESKQELLDFALSEAIALTGSKIGYIYFYDDKKREFILNTWSKGVMKECAIVEPQTIYQLEKTGLWGEAVRQKKPIVVNDFLAYNPLKKGYPEGHAPLLKYLTIPVIRNGQIVAVVGVANKEIDYTEADVRQLTLLMDSVWQISERKRVDDELRKLSRAVEQSPASIVITDKIGAIEYVNPKFVQLTGYSLEEAMGKNPRILKSDEKPSEEYKQLWDMITSGSEWRGEFHNKKKNGELYWESAVISPIKDERGVITHFLAVKEDITGQKRIEQALQYERTLLRILIDNIPDTIYSKDIACRKTLANFADLKNMRVQSEAEVIGKDDFAFYPKEMAQEFYDDDRRVLMTGTSVINKEECITDEHGQKRWLLTNKLPLRDEAGKIIGLVGVGRDITERKQSEEALRESEEKFRVIFENNSSAIAIIELDTTISMINDAYSQMSGYTKEEAVGMSWTQQIPPEDLERLKEYNRRRLMNPQDAPSHYEFKFYHKSGETRHGLISVTMMPGIKKIIASFADITDRKFAEVEREKLIKELQFALDNVKTLQGLIPICANCKKIRDDKGYWNQVEGYISQHTDATFSHGICPDCAKIFYGDIYQKSQDKLL